jgi:hypothetical protein
MENCRTPNKEQRLKVYKKALDAIENNLIPPADMSEHYLCLLLPMYLWNINHYDSNAPDGNIWFLSGVSEIFPEFTTEHIEIIKSFNYIIGLKNEMRIKILKEIIKSLED